MSFSWKLGLGKLKSESSHSDEVGELALTYLGPGLSGFRAGLLPLPWRGSHVLLVPWVAPGTVCWHQGPLLPSNLAHPITTLEGVTIACPCQLPSLVNPEVLGDS